MNKIAIYTAIFGGYDDIKELSSKSDHIDYFLFTDNEVVSDFWNVIKVNDLYKLDDTRKARYFKIKGHPLLDSYDYTIWIDANVDVFNSDFDINNLMSDKLICTFKHPKRNCIYHEALICLFYMRDSLFSIFNSMLKLFISGYPRNNGLVESNVLIRRRSKEVEIFNNYWWHNVAKFSKRDQLSFNYTSWALNIDYAVMGKANARGQSDFFRMNIGHKKDDLYTKLVKFFRRK